MPNFEEHNIQADKNISFLNLLQTSTDIYFDWKVTAAFYTSVHIINAHLAKTIDKHYQRHRDVEEALNPYNQLSVSKIDEETYLSYKRLHNLSRRSRYLIHEDAKNRQEERPHYISENHFKKAKNRLQEIINYFENRYEVKYETVK